MLYQIIPPILVVLSVIGIIVFLVKKTPEINRFEREEKMEKEREFRAMSGGANNFSEREVARLKVAAKLKQGSLVLLEKSVKKSQIIFLKLENRMKNLGEGIRKKRSSRVDEINSNERMQSEYQPKKEDVPATRETEALDGIIDKIGKYNPEKRNIRERLGLKQKAKQEEVEEKFFRPIISDHVVVPKRRRETKSRLEELLIERIAANPKDIEAYERLGEYYLEVKNLEHSKECFKQVLRLNPTNRNARYKIRKLEKILGS
ncbi:MAG: tetratricopeptide repeat protein [Candidatus Moranbacteria bacterium]|nr:tetratricopeptide repeat protein [Candidatus Moranbacteria bacterium]